MRESQTAADVLMIRPASFCANAQTAESNRFQQLDSRCLDPQQAALREFDALVAALRGGGVRVHVFDDTREPLTPDALFPNNWVSFHHDGSVVLYPMLAPNRRAERRTDILDSLRHLGFGTTQLIDLTPHERDERFLEGTGSLVLDRVNRIAYACGSPRTHAKVLDDFARRLGYEAIALDATDASGVPIYHTNVLMSVGERCAIVCAEAIASEQRMLVIERLRTTGHDVVEISREQMNCFAGNALELATASGQHVLALSARAARSLRPEQRAVLERRIGPLVTAEIPTIETLGGGSVRCMLAEIHLPRGA